MPIILPFILLLLCVYPALDILSQEPFICKGQLFLAQHDVNFKLNEIKANPLDGSVTLESVGNNMPININAVGFCRRDNLIYGWNYNESQLFRVDKNGIVENLKPLQLTPGMNYWGGDISPNGKFLVLIGGINSPSSNLDKELTIIDLTSPNYDFIQIPIDGAVTRTQDIAFDPLSGILYGYDILEHRLIVFDFYSRKILTPFPAGALIYISGALFFDPFGNLFAYGSKAGTVQNTLYHVDKTTGIASEIAEGPVAGGTDGCSCPYTVDIRKAVSPDTVTACSEVIYTFFVVNTAGKLIEGVDFTDVLPAGFTISDILRNPFGGTSEMGVGSQSLFIRNMTIPEGLDSIVVKVHVGDVQEGVYFNQAALNNLPLELGKIRLSDDAATWLGGDKTALRVISHCEEKEPEIEFQLFVPNVFSPNGDGFNDRFFLQGNDNILVKNLRIFSRWGELVFKAENMPLNDYSAGWNGRFKGEKLGSGVFAWMAEIETAGGDIKWMYGNVAIIK